MLSDLITVDLRYKVLCNPCLSKVCECQAVLESGSGRDINRHKYGMEEAEQALQQPVVQALLDLCKFRNTHQAFLGDVSPSLVLACS